MALNGSREFDYILAGGGLQSGLLVMSIKHAQPRARILVVERGEKFGGNHTWSFHRRDVPSAAENWLSGLATTAWNSYLVRFPGYEAEVDLEYVSTNSSMLAEAVQKRLSGQYGCGSLLLLNTEACDVRLNSITTSSGQQFTARCVIDCRGQRGALTSDVDQVSATALGFQKFYGVEIELEEDWPYSVPLLMDACVDQRDGFHFVYVLPFSRRRVLIEDTWFSEFPNVDFESSFEHLQRYIKGNTGSKWNAIRFESGCLPMPWQGLRPEPSSELTILRVLKGGYAGGWFHAATGYSFPLAAKFADVVASVPPEEAPSAIERLRLENEFRFGFGRFLNCLLFRLVSPQTRWQIFRRLYRSLPRQTLSRFYAHEFSKADAIRMIVGMPPGGLTPWKFLCGMRHPGKTPKSHQLETSQ